MSKAFITKAIKWFLMAFVALVVCSTIIHMARRSVNFESYSRKEAVAAFRDCLFDSHIAESADIWIGPSLVKHADDFAIYTWRTNNQAQDKVEIQITVKQPFFSTPNCTENGRIDRLMRLYDVKRRKDQKESQKLGPRMEKALRVVFDALTW